MFALGVSIDSRKAQHLGSRIGTDPVPRPRACGESGFPF